MLYSTFKDKKISKLGFGTMRLPVLEDKSIDAAETKKMVDYAMKSGVNYYDTGMPYHGGMSEIVIADLLREYPRESYFLADKYPGHQIFKKHHPDWIFEEQLEKCKVDYFDFYLLHNVYEESMIGYEDPRWDVIGYFIKQRDAGRIKHLGFSSHARPEAFEYFLRKYRNELEFCQIQLNYMDWTLQEAERKYNLLRELDMPTIVMEPIRGGRLAKFPQETKLRMLRPDESTSAWSFRWLQGKELMTVLSGMSTMEQLVDNVKTFSEEKPLSEDEEKLLFDIADELKDSVPCTRCRYCVESCPMGLDIPMLIHGYNDIKVDTGFTVGQHIEALPENKRPQACLKCGKCSKMCPQGIDIPGTFEKFTEELKKALDWHAISASRERELEEKHRKG